MKLTQAEFWRHHIAKPERALMRPADAARVMKVSVSFVHALIRKGVLKPIECPDGVTFVRVKEVLECQYYADLMYKGERRGN